MNRSEPPVYLYALTTAAPLTPLVGWADTRLTLITVQEIGAAVCTATAPPPTTDILWQHEAVVEHLMAERPLLPIRFGTTMPDKTAVRDWLTAHRHTIAEGLQAVAGHVELSVRVLTTARAHPSPHPTDRSSGTAYLRSRAAQEQRQAARRADLEAVCATLADDASNHTATIRPAHPMPLTAAFLVPHNKTDHFRARVAELDAAQTVGRLTCTGPWPPYHFVPAFNSACGGDGSA